MEDANGWSASASFGKIRHLCRNDISSQMEHNRSEPALIALFRLKDILANEALCLKCLCFCKPAANFKGLVTSDIMPGP